MSNLKTLLEQKQALENAIKEERERTAAARESAIADAKKLIDDHGLTRTDLFAPVIVAARYRGPNGEEWTGRGMAPNWLKDLEAKGFARDTFLIPA